jgi:hypothetical protein
MSDDVKRLNGGGLYKPNKEKIEKQEVVKKTRKLEHFFSQITCLGNDHINRSKPEIV